MLLSYLGRIAALLVVLHWAATTTAQGQAAFECGTTEESSSVASGVFDSFGGFCLPTTYPFPGNPNTRVIVYALIVFVDFPDDSADPYNAVWPLKDGDDWIGPQRPPCPELFTDIIDYDTVGSISNPTEFPSGKKYNITTYFRDMSFDKFIVLGHAVYQQAPNPSSTYAITGYENANFDVLLELRNNYGGNLSTLLPGGFDNWTHTGANRSFARGGDNTADLIIMVYRNTELASSIGGATGIAKLGPPGDPARSMSVNLTGTVMIRSGYGNGNGEADQQIGSGVTIFGIKDFHSGHGFQGIIHEVGHRLLGGDSFHKYGGGVWTLMGAAAEHYSMNSLERYQLGWNGFKSMNVSDGDSIRLDDYSTVSNQAVRVVIPGSTQYFLLENHQQRNSPYITSVPGSGHPLHRPTLAGLPTDGPTYDDVNQFNKSGLYMLYVDPSGISYSDLYNNTFDARGTTLAQTLPADGRWCWRKEDSILTACCGYQPLWHRGAISRHLRAVNPDSTVYLKENTAMSDQFVRYVPKPGGGYSAEFMWGWENYLTGQPKTPGWRPTFGDANDVWNLSENNIFSPWSNPSSVGYSPYNGTTGVGIEIIDSNSSGIQVKVFKSNLENMRPSKPQGPRFQSSQNILSWILNIEENFSSSGNYEVFMRQRPCSSSWSNWQFESTVNGNVSSIQDINWGVSPWECGMREWRIRAKDGSGRYSPYSDICHIEWGTGEEGIGSKVAMAQRAISGLSSVQAMAIGGTVRVTGNACEDGPARIVITNVMGIHVTSHEFHVPVSGNFEWAPDELYLPSGMYSCSVVHGDKVVSSSFIVVR